VVPMPVTSDRVKSDNKSDCDRAGASLIFFSKFIAESEAEREEKAARGGADMCTSQFRKSFVCSNIQEISKIRLRGKRKRNGEAL